MREPRCQRHNDSRSKEFVKELLGNLDTQA